VTEAVRTNLGQSKVISIVPPTVIAAALQRMQRPTDTTVNLALAREIAVRENVKAIVAGDVTQIGTSYVVSIRLVSADSGSDLAAYRASVADASQLLGAIDKLTRKLRGRIGESLKAVHDAPALDQVTTSSLDALRKYAEAVRASDLQGDYVKATQLLREAVALDTNFAMAYRKLGVTLNNSLMPRKQVDSALSRAFALRNRLPEKERYLAEATYYYTGPEPDRAKAADAFQRVLNIDPNDMTAGVNLANTLRSRRELARAESIYRAINSSSRATQISMSNDAGTLLAQGKVEAAESLYREIARQFPASNSAQTYAARFLYIRGQYDSLEGFWKTKFTDPNPLVKVGAMNAMFNIALLRGRLKQAMQYGAQLRAVNAARGVPPNPLSDSITSALVAIWFLGQNERGVRALDAALAASPFKNLPLDQRPYFSIASYYAWAGRTDKARALLAQYQTEVREPQLRRNMEPGRHAALAYILLAEKKPLEAVREIWASDSLPDGPSSECAHCIDDALGHAYDLANMPDSAIVHWERHIAEAYTRTPGNDALTLAGIYKRLGEMYEARSDYARAETNYSAFVNLWKGADPELQPKVAEVAKRLAAVRARKAG
jgi:Flp pilus assembly protein TadD